MCNDAEHCSCAVEYTHVGLNQIVAVRYKVVMVLHFAALLHAYEMLNRIQVLAAARTGQKLLHRHVLAQMNVGRILVGQRHLVCFLGRLVTRVHLFTAEKHQTKKETKTLMRIEQMCVRFD